MITKQCYKCNNNKVIIEFSKDSSRGDGYSPICKPCKKEQYNERNIKRENTQIPLTKKCNKCLKILNNAEFHKKSSSQDGLHTYCKSCKKTQRINIKEINVKLPDDYKKVCNKCNILKPNDKFYNQIYSNDKIDTICIDCSKEKNKVWRDKNPDKLKEYRAKQYPQSLINHKTRRQNDIEFKLLLNCRSRLTSAIKCNKNSKKYYHTKELIGCSPKFLKDFLEYHFDSNMSWNNYGTYWNMDHVIPCSYFDLTKKDEQLKCFNWKNIRPFNAIKNISKNAKIQHLQILLQELRIYFYKQQIQTDGELLKF